MTKKSWLLIAFAVVLAAVYVAGFTDWFRPKTIGIFHTHSRHARFRPAGATPDLIFGLNKEFKLTEIKVVPLAAWQTNDHVLPLWHLVSNSNSVPVKIFFYGVNIRGMKSAVPGARAEPLATNVVYRLFVTAGKAGGRHDFELGGSPAGETNYSGR